MAAFYSDCEHEVFEITKGRRVTLTYNPYYTPGVGDLAGRSPALSVQKLPLYQKVHEALTNPNFMPEGGHLGIFCTHAYAHTSKEAYEALPGVLKGADMAVYSVFQAHGLQIEVKTVLDDTEMLKRIAEYEEYKRSEGMGCGSNDGGSVEHTPFNRIGDVGDFTLAAVGGQDEDCTEDIRSWMEGSWRPKGPKGLEGNAGGVGITWLTPPPSKLGRMGFIHLTVSELNIPFIVDGGSIVGLD